MYKVGDKVKVKKRYQSFHINSNEATIVNVIRKGVYKIQCDDLKTTGIYYSYELDLLKYTQTRLWKKLHTQELD